MVISGWMWFLKHENAQFDLLCDLNSLINITSNFGLLIFGLGEKLHFMHN